MELIKLEKKYLESICEKEIMILLIINIACMMYGIFAYFCLSPLMFQNAANGQSEYKALMMIAIAVLFYVTAVRVFTKPDNKKLRTMAARLGIILCSEGYLLWGAMALYYSIVENRRLNFIVWLMVMGICVSTFFYYIIDYIILFIVNTIAAIIILQYNFKGQHDFNSLVNFCFFTVLFAVIYTLKHLSDLKAFARSKEMEQIREAKDLFTASMNHELRTPLNSIIGNAQILLEDGNLSAEEKEQIDAIYNSSNTMVQLVNDLLDYSKLEAGEFVIVPDQFSLVELRDNVDAMISNLAKEKNLAFEVTIDEGTPIQLVGDMRRIQQIVVNIATNGVKYTKVGKVKVSFTVWKGMLHIKCKDTGMGMAPETIEELYKPFNRINEQRVSNIQGTGLGMFIVKNLLESMNGTIEVASELNMGTTIRVDVPVKIVDENECYTQATLEKEKEERDSKQKNYDFTGRVILAVDDTVMNNKIIQNFLSSTNATVYTMLDGERCLKYLDNHKADIILMDHMMPGMNGLECLGHIRNSDAAYKDIPVIMLTGNAGDGYEELYQECGANGYLIKPIKQEKLLKIIKDNLK